MFPGLRRRFYASQEFKAKAVKPEPKPAKVKRARKPKTEQSPAVDTNPTGGV